MIDEFGGPSVLKAQSRPEPIPVRGWVSVKLAAAALNWHDCLLRQGLYRYPLPRIPGADGAGTRRDTGEAVVILPSLFWGTDQRAPGSSWEILGDQTDGTYSEIVAVPAENVFPMPKGWSFTEAAALPLAGLTAYRALFTRGGLQADETVLILGAGGGVATIAISLASATGARVLVTSSSPEKIELAKDLGASAGVLYTDPGWPEAIVELGGGIGVDLVLDSVGRSWPDSLRSLRAGGRLVTFGATGAAETQVDVRRFYFAQQTILGTTMGSPRDFAGLLALIQERPRWRPIIDRTLPLDQAAQAHELMERREHTGKIVLSIPHGG